jgi:hypothetical protein
VRLGERLEVLLQDGLHGQGHAAIRAHVATRVHSTTCNPVHTAWPPPADWPNARKRAEHLARPSVRHIQRPAWLSPAQRASSTMAITRRRRKADHRKPASHCRSRASLGSPVLSRSLGSSPLRPHRL